MNFGPLNTAKIIDGLVDGQVLTLTLPKLEIVMTMQRVPGRTIIDSVELIGGWNWSESMNSRHPSFGHLFDKFTSLLTHLLSLDENLTKKCVIKQDVVTQKVLPLVDETRHG